MRRVRCGARGARAHWSRNTVGVIAACLVGVACAAGSELALPNRLNGSTWRWEHKNNCTLAIEKGSGPDGGDCIVLRADFDRIHYSWARVRAQPAWDLTGTTGVEFRYRGGAPNLRLRPVIVQFRNGKEIVYWSRPMGRPRERVAMNGADQWRKAFVPWEWFQLPPEELRAIDSLHFSLDGLSRGTVTVRLANIRFLRKPGPGLALRIHGPQEFFSLFDLQTSGMEKVRAAVASNDWSAAERALIQYFRRRRTPRYFYSPADRDRIVRLLTSHDPKYGAHITARAQKVADLDFTFESIHCKLSDDPVWDSNALGVNWVFGCHLNRMFWLQFLGEAYWATGDEKWTRAFVRIVHDWIQKNPLPEWPVFCCIKGSPYGQTLEAAVRLSSWIQALQYFRDSPEFPLDRRMEFLRAIFEHARYLEYLEHGYYRGGNWQVVECSGLAEAGIMFPEVKEAASWRKTALGMLERHLAEDTYPDGSHSELTPGYHGWCVQQYRRALTLARLNGIPLSPLAWKRFEKLHEWYARMLMPDGRTPCPGDSGCVNPSSVFAYAAVAFDRPDLKYLSGAKTFPLGFVWVGGTDLIDRYARMAARAPAWGPSTLLPDAQYIVFRDGWRTWPEGRSAALFFDAAPWAGGHSHPDALNVDIAIGGPSLIREAGIRGYAHPHHIDYFRRTFAHNVLTIDGREQHQPQTPKLIACKLNDSAYDYASAQIEAPATGATWRRTVVFLRPDCFIIVDRVWGKGEHTLRRFFHTADRVEFHPPDRALFVWRGQHRAALAVSPEPGLTLTNDQGGPAFEGKPQCAVFVCRAALPWEGACVVVPATNDGVPAIERISSTQGSAGSSTYRLRVAGRSYTLTLTYSRGPQGVTQISLKPATRAGTGQ